VLFQFCLKFFNEKASGGGSGFQFLDVKGVDNANDDGDDAAVGVVKHLAGGVALAVDQDSVTDAGVGVIQGDEIPTRQVSRQG